MGVLHRETRQIVFVDTPGIHKPVTQLGERLNETARAALNDVDVMPGHRCQRPDQRGDRLIAEGLPPGSVVVVTKCVGQPRRSAATISRGIRIRSRRVLPVSGVAAKASKRSSITSKAE